MVQNVCTGRAETWQTVVFSSTPREKKIAADFFRVVYAR